MENCIELTAEKMNGPYNAIEMEVLENPGYETEGTDGKVELFKYEFYENLSEIGKT